MTSISFHADANDSLFPNGQWTWENIQNDVSKLSRTSFYEKYRAELDKAGLVVSDTQQNEEFRILRAEEIRDSLARVEKAFYEKGYSQWKEVSQIEKEFNELYESSVGAYSILKKRVYDLNLATYKDKNISSSVKEKVNGELSDLSRRIDHHHKAKSTLPSQAEMVAALGSLYNQRVGAVKTSSSSFALSSSQIYGLSAAVGIVILCGFFAMMRKRKKALELRRREEEQARVIPGAGLQRTGVITINGRGTIETMNLKASSLFNGDIKCGDQWDDYFQKNFYRGKKHLGVKGFYRYGQNSKVVFYLNGHMDKVSQMRTIEVGQMPLKDFDQALNLMERSSIRVDTMELFDGVFSELINLGQIDLSLDVFNLIHFGKGSDFLYLSEFEGKKYIGHVIKVIDAFTRFKNQGELSRIDIDREGGELLIKASVHHCSLSEDDLKERVIFENNTEKLNDILSSVQKLSQSYESSLFVKNLTINGERKVELKFKVQDNSNFQSLHRVKTVGNYANA